ncbi:MAG: hypothetical protein AB1806_13805 [Acidobacteriota bacterium]
MNIFPEDREGPEEAVVRPDPKYAVDPRRSRFLFVDIAAQRAKQLRRGAMYRIDQSDADAAAPPPAVPRKPERLAMDEVRLGYVEYSLPNSGNTPPGAGTDS